MNVYEQQARALKEIAVELKGIRRALDIIGKSLKLDDDQGDEEDVFMCSFFGGKCTQNRPGICSDPCDYREKGGAGNG